MNFEAENLVLKVIQFSGFLQDHITCGAVTILMNMRMIISAYSFLIYDMVCIFMT